MSHFTWRAARSATVTLMLATALTACLKTNLAIPDLSFMTVSPSSEATAPVVSR